MSPNLLLTCEPNLSHLKMKSKGHSLFHQNILLVIAVTNSCCITYAQDSRFHGKSSPSPAVLLSFLYKQKDMAGMEHVTCFTSQTRLAKGH